MSSLPKRYCIKLSEDGGKHYLFITPRGTTTALKIRAAVGSDLDRYIWLCQQDCEPGQIWRVVEFDTGNVVSEVRYTDKLIEEVSHARSGSQSGTGEIV